MKKIVKDWEQARKREIARRWQWLLGQIDGKPFIDNVDYSPKGKTNEGCLSSLTNSPKSK